MGTRSPDTRRAPALSSPFGHSTAGEVGSVHSDLRGTELETVKIFKSLIFLLFFMCAGCLFGGCQAPPEELANRCRSARHSMPKSKILNGLEFVQRDGDLSTLNSFGFGCQNLSIFQARARPHRSRPSKNKLNNASYLLKVPPRLMKVSFPVCRS